MKYLIGTAVILLGYMAKVIDVLTGWHPHKPNKHEDSNA